MLRPLDSFTNYRVRINYELKIRPKAFVISPGLALRAGETRIPHTFGPNDRPCLFMPHEWNDQKVLADTVVPWLSLWLFYYEMWHMTGEWLGGGHCFAADENPKKLE